MNLLTTSGYKNIEDCSIGEQLIAYDVNTGQQIINELLGKELFSPEMFQDTDLDFYKVNDNWILYENQSIWCNLSVIHVKDLKVGDTIYDDSNNDVIINSIERITSNGWWRLTVSGDHSYIIDDLTVHNASRYWVGGGSSSNWNATVNTNWGSSSGTQDNSSVPSSVDDVIFDGAGTGGNTNSTISATITVLSLNIQSGYTATMTHNAVLTIAGNWTYTGGYTIAGTSGITINASSTITSNGTTWTNSLTFSGANTKTLVGNLTVSGLLTTRGTINKTTNEILTISNGITLSETLSGSADIYITGGTWSGNFALSNNFFINGNITISGTVNKNTGDLTHLSGTVTTTNSSITFSGAFNYSGSAITWNNVRHNGTFKITLLTDIYIAGLLDARGFVSEISSSNGSKIISSGGITVLNGWLSATILDITGGTISGGATGTGSGSILAGGTINLNGNITFSGTGIRTGGTWNYVSGNINWGEFSLFLGEGSSTFNTNGTKLYRIKAFRHTITLTSNLQVYELFGELGYSLTINKTSNESVETNIFKPECPIGGNSIIYVIDGKWEGTATVSNPVYLVGNVTISGNIFKDTNFLDGRFAKVKAINTILNLNGTFSVLGFGKTPLDEVKISGGSTITLDEFFCGLPTKLCKVSSTSSNYTINFTDSFEKIAKYVFILNCNINNILIINNSPINTNRQTNSGIIRYKNQSPNGFNKNKISNNYTLTGVINDPNFAKLVYT